MLIKNLNQFKKKKILITGASGNLGKQLFIFKQKKYKLYGVQNKSKNKNFINCNLIYKKNIFNLLDRINPDIIIHSAALIDLDFCEKNKKASYYVNVKSTKNIVEWILKKKLKKNIKFIYISSDQVYGKNYKNNTEKKSFPINTYARHKLMSEIELKKLSNYTVLRTNFVTKGYDKKNLSDWIVYSFKNNVKLKLFDNISFNPMSIKTLSETIYKIIILDLRGVYNVGSNVKKKFFSKADFAIKLAKKLKILNKNYEIVNYDISKSMAPRPINMLMNIEKIEKHIKMPTIERVLSDLVIMYSHEK
jgi:dTDP-4-dehydrorhamnose reductase